MDMKSEEYKNYCADLKALGPVNTDEKAKQYRGIWEKYHGVSIYTGEEKNGNSGN